MYGVVQKWGNSQAIRLPKTVLETVRFTENEQVQIFTENDRIIIKKSDQRKHRTLKDRLAGFEGKYASAEWETGAPVGKERFWEEGTSDGV